VRILITAFAERGHVFPAVSAAWAARLAGHEVLVATSGRNLDSVTGAGLPAADATPGLPFDRTVRRLMADASGGRLSVLDVFTRLNDLMADGMVRIADAWRPDLVVHTPQQLCGPLVATRLGVPSVLLMISAGSTAHDMSAMYPGVHDAFVRHGVPTGPAAPDAVLDPFPPSVVGGPPRGESVRLVPCHGGAVLPEWLFAPRSRPRICVTLGTLVPHLVGTGALRGLVAAAGDVDAEFVLALDGAGRLGRLPDNVRITEWVPLGALLDTCSAVVHHGGAGTALAALTAGLPQVVLPHAADQPANAERLAARGLATTLRPDDVTPPVARAALDRLLGDTDMRRAAAEVRAEIEAMPTITHALRGLVGATR
jgi:enterobactin C-glucosyltransferase